MVRGNAYLIRIAPDTRNKRQTFLNELDIALVSDGVRVRTGWYKVTIERASEKEVKEAIEA